MSRRLLGFITIVVCLAVGRVAAAQTASDDFATPAHVSVVQGTALLERNGQAEAVTENLPLLEGDRLRTEAGRLEVILPDGSALALDHHSTLDLLAGGLMRLLGGRMVFVVSRQLEGEPRRDYQVDAPAGIVRVLTGGEYHISTMVTAGLPSVDLAVVRGEAILDANGTSVSVGSGQRTMVTEGQGVVPTRAFNSASTDAFYVWADGLRAERVGSRSNAYLPPDLQVYGGTFDRDGTWDNTPDSGWAWYPRVSTDWRPYYDGTWQPYGWGWTWVGSGRWMWPTHHYGRWGHGAQGWFWLPAAQWGPAWVSWGFAADYVSWCPLGYDDSPVFGLSSGFSMGSRFSPWQGWTVVPHDAFGRASRVPAYAVRGDHLRAVERSSFAVRRTGPAVPGMAVPRRRSDQPGSPYQRAEAVADQRAGGSQGSTATRGDASIPGRPNVAQRSWSDDASSPYGRAQALAAERLAQSEPGAAARSRNYDTRPFASLSQTPLPYLERFRSTVGPQYRDPGGATVPRSESVPRSTPGVSELRSSSGSAASPVPGTSSAPRDSAVPRYYMGPGSNSTSRAASPSRSYSSPRPASSDRSSYDRRSYSAPSSEPRAYGTPFRPMPHSSSSSGPAAVPRSNSASGIASAPSSPEPRSYSTPGSGSGRPSAPPSSGVSGGRSPGRSSQGSPTGGRPSGGAPARGGRGR